MAAEDAAPLRTLIVDDEPLAVERLQLLCAREPGIALVGTATDGDAALRLAEALKPDLLLLDISMPERDGMSVARALGQSAERPAVIFITAFDSFAVEAFDLAAIDYLLKPVAPDRLSRAIARVGEKKRQAPPPGAPAEASPYAEEFWVPHRAELIRVAAEDIDRIDAERDYMRLHVGARSFLLHQTISALEERLDPDRFIRLHRSTIVRRDRIAKLRHDGSGVWYADLADGHEVRIGRTYLAAAKGIAGR
ncbi:MAG: DNA-binding response regulator [Sphingomonas sanxanigenens]|uniref:DNA-binding response regulator n=1 Tax=Sphingomonas sanxanigenens TaxID=397260 RepID=A0A2W5C6U2_9SPHN|nr:MAG: DNA-binding response regulator [Sphingomonas sanxanigenens]